MKLNSKILILLIIIFSSCQKREWNNPFDPDCPKELFTPTNFVAVQEGNSIKLTWQQPVNNISGFRIERKIEGEASWKEVVSPTKTTITWTDPGITGGKLYEYRIVALAGANESNFATTQIKPLLIATLSTAVPSAIAATSALLGGTITTDGGATITERGVCWATATSPATSNNKLAIGSGTGNFSNTLTGLTANTTYYVRAYAINSQGTAYGNEVNFKTSVVLSIATLTTNAATNITSNSATLGGNVTSDGNATVTERGVCYSTSTNPTTNNTKLAIGTGTGSFSNTITGLTANTTYYVRAYAINSLGTAYGNEVNFKTSVVLSLATLTTNATTNITNNSATLGGNVTNDGNATVTERGVCFSTSQNPTTSNTKVVIGNGNGTFSNTITGLAPNTTYYVRSYATNSQGTAYGNEVNFKTSVVLSLATLTTSAAIDITSTSATLGGNITNDGNATVTDRGVCYSTSTNPTTINTKLAIGNGVETFSSSITGLTANTTYYVRAYAINSQGTAYGNQESFTTLEDRTMPPGISETVTDIDGNIYHTVTIGTQVWMVENLKTTKYNDGTAIPIISDGTTWSNLSTPGFCWYNNDISFKNPYGALYNWYTVNTGILAPTGWHVPSDAEWTTLSTFLGGESVAGGKMKTTTVWNSPNTGATNSSGFTALPGGERHIGGTFVTIGILGEWWSSTESSTSSVWDRNMIYSSSTLGRIGYPKEGGFSIRCIKGEPTISATIPTLGTVTASNITVSSAVLGGTITSDGGASITSKGVCWSTTSGPTMTDSKTTDGSGSGSFISNLTSLTANTTYYVRAYAINSQGTAYGNEVNFKTSVVLSPATLTTNAATNITNNSAILGGNITSDGNALVTERGVCYSTSTNPTTSNTKLAIGSGTGSFNNTITNLTANTIYYVRAYAINSQGTAYGNEVSFKTLTGGTPETVTDIDGNGYHTVAIGTQVWMVENLKVTKYNDGTAIPLVMDNTVWNNLITPGYCWYNNDATTYKNTYGALYNWYAVNTGKLAPTGWHVPTDAEWTTLTTFLGGEDVAGGKLKETGTTHWLSPNAGATNETGFTALPGGYRNDDGTFYSISHNGDWWSSTEVNTLIAWSRYLYYNNDNVRRDLNYKVEGHSVRCVKD